MFCTKYVAAAIAAGAGAACAEPIVNFTDGPGNTGGGIFHAATSAHGTFDTFCAEIGEGLSFAIPWEYGISTDIIYNGNNTINPLDAETAFIYTTFRNDGIRDIIGNVTDDELADSVQLAIWKIEGGQNTNDAGALALIDAAQDAIGDGSWSGLGNVRVMNNFKVGHFGDPDDAGQDTLIIVPLPSAAGLAAVGLLGVGFAARRRNG